MNKLYTHALGYTVQVPDPGSTFAYVSGYGDPYLVDTHKAAMLCLVQPVTAGWEYLADVAEAAQHVHRTEGYRPRCPICPIITAQLPNRESYCIDGHHRITELQRQHNAGELPYELYRPRLNAQGMITEEPIIYVLSLSWEQTRDCLLPLSEAQRRQILAMQPAT